MKILSIKEKAEAYDKVSKEVKEFFEGKPKAYTKDVSQTLEHLFPELKKDGENERTRKELLDFIKGIFESPYSPIPSKSTLFDWIKWLEKLEKQGEPNPYSGTSFEYNEHAWGMCARDGGVEVLCDGNLKAFLSSEKSFIYDNDYQESTSPKPVTETVKEEKVSNSNKPKFKIGDWIVKPDDGRVFHIMDIKDSCYIFNKDESHYWITCYCDQNCHLWTIEDAKDGDILCTHYEPLIIFPLKLEGKHIKYYCYYDIIYSYFYCDSGCKFPWPREGYIRPATEEQRELLFRKMKDAGWEWDADKKELKRLQQAQ